MSILIEQMKPAVAHRSWIDVLEARAQAEPGRIAFTFLDEKNARTHVTYRELEAKARAIAAELSTRGAAGERVLLLYPYGFEYVCALFGCLSAAAIAVPAYPPRLNRSFERLQNIVIDAKAAFALTTTKTIAKFNTAAEELPALQALLWIDSETLEQDESNWRRPAIDPEDLALLQYTSGSTGTPRGVMLTHANLLHNSGLLRTAFGYDSDSRCVSWLPAYHDMGLIGGVLQPVFGGFPCTMMSPAAFLKSPFRWLELISEERATISGAPNFAYDLCVGRITPEQIKQLDLSSWAVAFNGAEPVRADTLEKFSETFAPAGFRAESFYPCYGLAEATLFVCGKGENWRPPIKMIAVDVFKRNRISEASPAQDAQSLVSSGRLLPDQTIAIVRPGSSDLCEPDEIGEICLSSPSVALGYWNNSEATAETFGLKLGPKSPRYLRTGDLGFVNGGELYVTGRLKDVIVIRGENHYPQDIEATVAQLSDALRPASCAAVAIEAAGEERLAIIQEVDSSSQDRLADLIDDIREAVAVRHQLQVFAVILVKRNTIPRTTSGKIRRRSSRAALLDGKLAVIAQWRADSNQPFDAQSLLNEAAPRSIESWLVRWLSLRFGISSERININTSITRFGLDSLTATELAHSVTTELGVDLPMITFLQGLSIAQVAEAIRNADRLTPLPSTNGPESTAPSRYPLSRGQRALWLLRELSPESAAYNLVIGARVKGQVDVVALRQAFQDLVDRHTSLRTTFVMDEGTILQTVIEQAEIYFNTCEVGEWTPEFLNGVLMEEAHRPFDLSTGPLLRVNLYSHSADDHILALALHHIVADLWSFGILIEELGPAYMARKQQSKVEFEPWPVRYDEYVSWQDRMLAGPVGEKLWEFWQRQLAGMPLQLGLPVDHPRPAVQTYHGASLKFKIPAEYTSKLQQLAGKHNATLYMVLAAIFQVLLYRYCDQEDLAIGSLTTGRSRPEWTRLVGYFVNSIVLRADLSGRPSFEDFLLRTRTTVIDALAHQDFPFPTLVERMQPDRDPSRSPLFQVLFAFQNAYSRNDSCLASFALKQSTGVMELGDLQLEPLALEQRTAQFDLTLLAVEAEGEINSAFEYSTDLFEHSTIEQLAEHFQTLVAHIVADPSQRINELQMLSQAERRQLLGDWNQTAAELPANCIHREFERQVEQTPDHDAVSFENESLTYGELNKRANQLAHYLIALGIAPEKRAGIFIDRSLEMVIALLGVLKAGGAYVPLDPSYPAERIGYMISNGELSALLTKTALLSSLPKFSGPVVVLDGKRALLAEQRMENPEVDIHPGNLAYVIYTSGSTGKPKGVAVTHEAVSNFFGGMDKRIGCHSADTMMAVTSISFDISVLELFWTLSRGARVVLLGNGAWSFEDRLKLTAAKKEQLDFSLFYFASDDQADAADQYRLLFEGAKFADRHGFTAVWTPERHFHAFGGLYPNPAVIGGALAAMTEQIQIRAGSVVLPLHNPIRVAEEWALVDNLSKGRVGIAFASGWHADDFVFFPEKYPERKRIMFEDIEVVQRLWQGEAIEARSGSGHPVELRILPRPVQPVLPIWITAAGSAETFTRAGEIGANVLTHLLGQSLDDLAEKIKLYRQARAKAGHGRGHVTLMLHTFIGNDKEEVREKVRAPFTNYLKSSVGLIANLAKSLGLNFDPANLAGEDAVALLGYAFARYFDSSALFGTPESCQSMIDSVKHIGCNEVACLIDFGVDVNSVLRGLEDLEQLMVLSNGDSASPSSGFSAWAEAGGVTMMQCTPSMLSMMALDPRVLDSLSSLRVLLVGGEPLPAALAKQLKQTLSGKLMNLYGPTETTVWSAVDEVTECEQISVGTPIVNTQIHILDRSLQPLPVGVPGEVYIGGRGLARGYVQNPEATAEKFIPNPFGAPGTRLYRTGDVGRYLPDGRIELQGRLDSQIKLRGFRIELGEIESVLAEHEAVHEAVVLIRGSMADDQALVAYVVPAVDVPPSIREFKEFLKSRLPDYMLPSAFVLLEQMPLTANRKIDRRALPNPVTKGSGNGRLVMPRDHLEQTIAQIWRNVLKLEQIGVHDNFFDLGGHSLLMAHAHALLNEALDASFPLVKIFEHPTIRSLARFIRNEQPEKDTFAPSRNRANKQLAALRKQRAFRQRR